MMLSEKKVTKNIIGIVAGIFLTLVMFVAGYRGISVIAEENTTDTDTEFEESISDFPESYKTYLRELHIKYPEWKFVMCDTGLEWNDVIEGESCNNKSLVQNVYSNLLKSRASGDYNAATKTYIYKDGSSWVSASRATVAYFVDPRNFLNEKQIYQFELLSFDENLHTVEGTNAVLKNSFMYDTVVTYLTSDGTQKTYADYWTYAYMIYNAGLQSNVSPYYLAAKIQQEIGVTGSSTVPGMGSSGSISGTYKGYEGIYNFYNIGANDGTNAVANGLKWASSGSTYNRAWTTPRKSIEGGALYIAENYISRGQNTGYFQRFNVVTSSLYTHQYMTSIYAIAAETNTTYSAYNSLGILADSKVFYIPVYNNMPSESTTIKLQSTTNKTGTALSSVNMRSGPGTSYDKVTTLPQGTTVTVKEGVRSDVVYSTSWLNNPYWYSVEAVVDGTAYTGYVCAEYIKLKSDLKVYKDSQKTLTTILINANGETVSEKVYYETDDPAIATVDENGIVTGVSVGQTTIYAYTGAGSFSSCLVTVKPVKVTMKSIGSYGYRKIRLRWDKIDGVTGYLIYRSTSKSGTYKRVAKITNNSIIEYKDSNLITGTTYYYKIRAYKEYDGTTIYGKYSSKVSASPKPWRGKITSIKNNKKSKVTLQWKKVKGATGYAIYRKIKGGKYKRIATVKGNTTFKYTDKDLTKDSIYYYKIRAYRKVDGKNYYGKYSTVKKITITK